MELEQAIKHFTDKGIEVRVEGFFEDRMYGMLVIKDSLGLKEPTSLPFGGYMFEELPLIGNIEVEVEKEGKVSRVNLYHESMFIDTCPDDMSLNMFRKKLSNYMGKPIAIHYKEEPLLFDLTLVSEEPYLIRNRGLENIPHNVTIRTVIQSRPTLVEWAGVIDEALKLLEEGYTFCFNGDYCSFLSPNVDFGYGEQVIKTLLTPNQ
jgi:hypothetical protein